MANEWIRKIKRGMILEFSDGTTDTVIATGYFGKNSKRPDKKGKHMFFCNNKFMIDWCQEEPPRILGFADKRDMRRINRINDLAKHRKK